MVMMDDERYKNEYNEVRKMCLCKNPKNETCNIKRVKKMCVEDDWKTCPLFTFIKQITKENYGK